MEDDKLVLRRRAWIVVVDVDVDVGGMRKRTEATFADASAHNTTVVCLSLN